MRLYFFLLVFIPILSFGQYTDIHDVIEYDTTIAVPSFNLQGRTLQGLKYKREEKIVWFNFTGHYTSDTIILYNVNIESKQIKVLKVYVGALKSEFKFGSHDFVLSDSNDVIFLLNGKLLIAPILEKEDIQIKRPPPV
jgi:hypothetical protein